MITTKRRIVCKSSTLRTLSVLGIGTLITGVIGETVPVPTRPLREMKAVRESNPKTALVKKVSESRCEPVTSRAPHTEAGLETVNCT